jgi:membrane protein required for colicin V production
LDDHIPMTWTDGIMLAIIAISGLLAMVRGLVRELLGIGAWIGAGFAALAFYPHVEPLLDGIINNPKLIVPVSFAIVFLVVLVILLVISAWIGSLVRDSVLSGLDRSLGLAFGLVRGGVIICLLYIGLSMLLQPAEWPRGLVNARLLPYAQSGAVWIVGFLPPAYQPHVARAPGTTPTAAQLMTTPVSSGPGKGRKD